MKLNDEIDFCFLPYVLEADRKPLKDYFKDSTGRRVIFSHNDIAGIRMGVFESKIGFDINDIQDNCELFLNGHLHNGTQVAEGVYNLGNLTGQNFSEDASKYMHCAFILDTDTLSLTPVKNPYALNFYKSDNASEFIRRGNVEPNSIVTVKCKEDEYDSVKEFLETKKEAGTVLDYRILLDRSVLGGAEVAEDNSEQLMDTVDHLNKFVEYVHEHIGNSDIVNEELSHILG